jgi:DNA polymerase elongation subunit (family B)
MKVLSIDIETSPNLAHVWGLWQQNIGATSQLLESTEMLCFAAKWLGVKGKPEFYSTYAHGKTVMVGKAWGLLDEADVVMHYNGRRFDVPHLNREFLQLGLKPPAPFKQIDLMEVVKRRFKFPSNSLAYVSKALGLRGKVPHTGHQLWIDCLAGDPKAWLLMEKYNKQDVVLLEELYALLQPWVPSHPSHAAETGQHVCPSCGSDQLTKQGTAYTAVSAFQRWRCTPCGAWSRSTKRDFGTTITQVAI